MEKSVYRYARRFKIKYSFTVAMRIRKHSAVIENILDDDEEVLYAFCGQKNGDPFMFFDSCVVALTNKRMIIGQKRVLWGYFLTSISPKLYNDIKIQANLLWGTVIIDTAKELVKISDLSKSSLDEIETRVNRIMIEARKYLMEKDKD